MKIYLVVSGFCLVLPCSGWTQTMGFSGGGMPEPKSDSAINSNVLLLPPFRYIEPVVVDKSVSGQAPKRSLALQKLVDLNAAGEYQAVGTQGLGLMTSEKLDDELQLIVANSLAWTGRIQEAVPLYQGVSKGQYANEANVGLANINRWRGRDDLALPLYQNVLSKDPTNAEALDGVEMALRELSPRTTVGAGVSSDSSDSKRRSGVVNHRWRDKSGANIFEIEGNGNYDWTPTDAEPQRDLTLRYQSLGLPLKPSLELSLPDRLNASPYGAVSIKLADDHVTLGAGRLNWGKTVGNPVAYRQRLAANFLSVQASQSFSMGSLVGRMNYYEITGGGTIANTIWTTAINFNSAWRPLGVHFKPFAGVETRTAKYNAPTYWSPAQGSGSLYAGLLGEWGEADWSLFASGQLGAPLFGDAGNSWSASVGGKRWLTRDIALGLNYWSMASWRDNATYRSQSMNVNLEKLWR